MIVAIVTSAEGVQSKQEGPIFEKTKTVKTDRRVINAKMFRAFRSSRAHRGAILNGHPPSNLIFF